MPTSLSRSVKELCRPYRDRSESSACYFNAAFRNIYTNAIQRVLNFIDHVREAAIEKDENIRSYLEPWPHKFRNLGWDFLPPGSSLVDALHRPAIIGIFRLALGPAAALFLTDRHILCLADQRSRSRFAKKDQINCRESRAGAGGLRSVVAATAEELGFTHCFS